MFHPSHFPKGLITILCTARKTVVGVVNYIILFKKIILFVVMGGGTENGKCQV